MKRIVIAILLLSFPMAAAAFDSSEKRGDRIAVLRMGDIGPDGEAAAAGVIRRYLRDELRQAGFDAFTTDLTYDDVLDAPRDDVDFYVAVVPHYGRTDEHGGVGFGGRHGGVELSVLRTIVEAEIRVYDGRTLERIGARDVRERSTAVMPTSVGVGGGRVYGWLALPFVSWAHSRRLARNVAEEAAEFVASVVRG